MAIAGFLAGDGTLYFAERAGGHGKHVNVTARRPGGKRESLCRLPFNGVALADPKRLLADEIRDELETRLIEAELRTT